MESKAYDAVEIDDWDLEVIAERIYSEKRDVGLDDLVKQLIKCRVDLHFVNFPNTSQTLKTFYCNNLHNARGGRFLMSLENALQKGSIRREFFSFRPSRKHGDYQMPQNSVSLFWRSHNNLHHLFPVWVLQLISTRQNQRR